MSTRQLRSSSRNRAGNSDDIPTTTTATVNNPNAAPIVSTNAVTPLLSISFPPGFGPQTHSSPDSFSTIRTPTYSSITAREISGQTGNQGTRDLTLGNMNRNNLPPVGEEVDPEMVITEDGLTLRDYVSASVGAAQAAIMNEVQNMQLMLPQLIRESLRSERGISSENQTFRHNAPYDQQRAYQTPFNNNNNRPPPAQHFAHNDPQMFRQQRPRQPNLAQPVFENIPQHFAEQFPGFGNSPSFHGFKPITPNQLEKWGIRYDGTNKSLTVEDFVFRVEALKHDSKFKGKLWSVGKRHMSLRMRHYRNRQA